MPSRSAVPKKLREPVRTAEAVIVEAVLPEAEVVLPEVVIAETEAISPTIVLPETAIPEPPVFLPKKSMSSKSSKSSKSEKSKKKIISSPLTAPSTTPFSLDTSTPIEGTITIKLHSGIAFKQWIESMKKINKKNPFCFSQTGVTMITCSLSRQLLIVSEIRAEDCAVYKFVNTGPYFFNVDCSDLAENLRQFSNKKSGLCITANLATQELTVQEILISEVSLTPPSIFKQYLEPYSELRFDLAKLVSDTPFQPNATILPANLFGFFQERSKKITVRSVTSTTLKTGDSTLLSITCNSAQFGTRVGEEEQPVIFGEVSEEEPVLTRFMIGSSSLVLLSKITGWNQEVPAKIYFLTEDLVSIEGNLGGWGSFKIFISNVFPA